jgi:protein-tyrosine sulfotransferase
MAGSPFLVRLRNRTARLRQRRWRMGGHTSTQQHIVMGGAPRSGTTVLRRVFDRHPEVCSGAETKLFVPAAFNLAWLSDAYEIPFDELQYMRAESLSQAGFIDAFAEHVRRDAGKARWAEKTPMNIRYLDWIMEHFPEASIVHIIRDGRDVVCSMREHPDWRWVDGAWQKVLVPRPLDTYAQRWLTDTNAGIAWRDDPRYVEIRYEDLVEDVPGVLQHVCDGIGVSLDAEWLAAVRRPARAVGATGSPDYEGALSSASVGRWREDLKDSEQEELGRLLGPQLELLGYSV